MLNNLGFPEIVVLGLVGLFVFGPERLPHVLRDAARTIRTLRQMAQQATDEIKGELGPELQGLSLADMHPKALVKKHLIDPAFLEDEIKDVQDALKGITSAKDDVTRTVRGAVDMSKPAAAPAVAAAAAPHPSGLRLDPDAT